MHTFRVGSRVGHRTDPDDMTGTVSAIRGDGLLVVCWDTHIVERVPPEELVELPQRRPRTIPSGSEQDLVDAVRDDDVAVLADAMDMLATVVEGTLWGPLSRVESVRQLRRVRERVARLASERRTG